MFAKYKTLNQVERGHVISGKPLSSDRIYALFSLFAMFLFVFAQVCIFIRCFFCVFGSCFVLLRYLFYLFIIKSYTKYKVMQINEN